ncbi:hypothetical protein GDO81_014060 [Engystomops pustulosus]|uniref:Uncharacterized protein n=1 Tax=Engystomops pustulosus TaxID=76066 RepID=A0AAV7B7N7_ENGPU|nr:hypothetical protein GDO81_014060 [Engystomops pustulosus]
MYSASNFLIYFFSISLFLFVMQLPYFSLACLYCILFSLTLSPPTTSKWQCLWLALTLVVLLQGYYSNKLCMTIYDGDIFLFPGCSLSSILFLLSDMDRFVMGT